MIRDYVILTNKELTLQEFYDMIRKRFLDARYMPIIETASGYRLENIPKDHGTTRAFVVYCNMRTMLNTIKTLPCVINIFEGADEKVILR